MKNNREKEIIFFLKDQGLYNGKCFWYLKNCGVRMKLEKNCLPISCTIHVDCNGKLQDVIPIVPYGHDQRIGASYVYVYVETLCLISRLGEKYVDDFSDLLLPLFYSRLYLLESKNETLKNYDNMVRECLEKEEISQGKILLQKSDDLLRSYYLKEKRVEKIGNKVKRLAKEKLYK